MLRYRSNMAKFKEAVIPDAQSASRNPVSFGVKRPWIPAFAGMTAEVGMESQ